MDFLGPWEVVGSFLSLSPLPTTKAEPGKRFFSQELPPLPPLLTLPPPPPLFFGEVLQNILIVPIRGTPHSVTKDFVRTHLYLLAPLDIICCKYLCLLEFKNQ